MVVENHAVHSKVKHERVRYGCWNQSREQRPYMVAVKLYDDRGSYIGDGTQRIEPWASALCRHTGEYSKDPDGSYSWKEDPNCAGCHESNKDHEYITRMRGMVEQEMQQMRLHR